MKTARKQPQQRLSKEQALAFSKIFRSFDWLYSPVLDCIAQQASTSQTVHDCCCGTGHLLHLIQERLPDLEVSGSDMDPYLIDIASKQYGLNTWCANSSELEDSYDIITCNLALHLLAQPVSCVNHWGSLTRKLIISDQLRPETTDELHSRKDKRYAYIKEANIEFHVDYESDSILEAYSRSEVEILLGNTKLDFQIDFLDNDYYERFIAVAEL